MAILENGDKKYSTLVDEIEKGEIKIPQFQRQFVWDINSSAKLIDSILKGYPIGTFIYWRTNERLRSIRNVGNIDLPEPKDGEFVNYVLDGQQRITSLFAALKGEMIERDNGKKEDFSKIFIDLNAKEDEELVITDISKKDEYTFVSLTDLMGQGRRFFNQFPEKYDSILDKYKEILQSYQFKGINLKDAEIDVATEVFTRLNVGGKELSLFEIMVAKTYDPSRNFDLYEKFQDLVEDLKPVNYETISSANVLQLISLLITRECTRKTILKLDKQKFIETWESAESSVKSAVDFFRGYGIPVSRLLPYNTLIVPFAYFFHKYGKNPTGQKLKLLEDFFWRVSLGFRYSSGVESKLAQDIDKIDQIIDEKQPRYEWAVKVNKEFVETNGWFGTGKSFIKAVLCLFAKKKPKSFDSNLNVNIDNSWLKIASSKNYHHFFPKSWLKKNYPECEYFYVNHIVNITIVDEFLNKRTIKAKSPSNYMKDFFKSNDDLKSTMKTHMIDIDTDGIWDNDYDLFYDNRLNRIAKALDKFIIKQEQDHEDLEVYEDIEEVEISEI